MKWYVYHLINPLTDVTFYVGKGSGRRDISHLTCGLNHPKNAVMDQIRAQGAEPIVRRIAHFYDEYDALAFESEQIASLKGLTNIDQNPCPPRVIGLFSTLNDLADGRLSLRSAIKHLRVLKPHADGEHLLIIDRYLSFLNQPIAHKVYA